MLDASAMDPVRPKKISERVLERGGDSSGMGGGGGLGGWFFFSPRRPGKRKKIVHRRGWFRSVVI